MAKVQKYPKLKIVTLPLKSAFWYVEVVVSGSSKTSTGSNKSGGSESLPFSEDYVYSTRCALIRHFMGSKYPKGSAFASISQYDLIQSLSSYSKDRRATALASSQ